MNSRQRRKLEAEKHNEALRVKKEIKPKARRKSTQLPMMIALAEMMTMEVKK